MSIRNIMPYIGALILMLICVWPCFKATRLDKQSIEDVNMRLDMPLEKVTVKLNRDAVKEAFERSSWANVDFTLSRSLCISAKSNQFALRVNPVNSMDNLMKVAGDSEFEWDGKVLLLPSVGDKMVLVPSWIAYRLVEEGCFSGL